MSLGLGCRVLPSVSMFVIVSLRECYDLPEAIVGLVLESVCGVQIARLAPCRACGHFCFTQLIVSFGHAFAGQQPGYVCFNPLMPSNNRACETGLGA